MSKTWRKMGKNLEKYEKLMERYGEIWENRGNISKFVEECEFYTMKNWNVGNGK